MASVSSATRKLATNGIRGDRSTEDGQAKTLFLWWVVTDATARAVAMGRRFLKPAVRGSGRLARSFFRDVQ